MKLRFSLFAYLLLPALAFGTATVTGHVSNPGLGIASGSNYWSFELQGCGNNPARATQGGEAGTLTNYKRVAIDASGNSSDTIVRNDQISCGGQTTSTFYLVTLWINNSAVPGTAQKYRITASAFDLNSATPITVNPVVVPPTGDTTYARLDAGNQPFTGTILGPMEAITNPGVFTNTQQNDYFTSILNGTNIGSEFTLQQDGNFGTEAIAGAVTIPGSATVHQADALAGYVVNGNTTTSGVAVYGQARATANANIWGGNFLVASTPGIANTHMNGVEVDVNVNNTGDSGEGIAITGAWAVQPSGSLPAILVVGPSNLHWSDGLRFNISATLAPSATNAALFFAPVCCNGGANKVSQGITFQSTDSGASFKTATQNLDSAGNMQISSNVQAPAFLGTAFVSTTANVSVGGQLRLAHADAIAFRNNANSGDFFIGMNASDQLTVPPIVTAKVNTDNNCSSTGGTCGSAAAGSVGVAAAATTVTVSTTAVTANSQIILTRDNSLGTKLGVTCNTQSSLVLGTPYVSARTAGTSFVITIDVAPTTNPMCIGYQVVN